MAPSDPPPDSTKAVVGLANAIASVRCRCHRIDPPLHGPIIGRGPSHLSACEALGSNDRPRIEVVEPTEQQASITVVARALERVAIRLGRGAWMPESTL